MNYPLGSTKASKGYIREKAREGIPVVIDADPEAGKPLFMNLETYATYNPVMECDRPEEPQDVLRRCRLELPGHEI